MRPEFNGLMWDGSDTTKWQCELHDAVMEIQEVWAKEILIDIRKVDLNQAEIYRKQIEFMH
jgi:hypothetical protein